MSVTFDDFVSGEPMPITAETKRNLDFVRIRDTVFPAIRDSIKCMNYDALSAGCERGNCVCAEAACAVAGALSD